LWIGGNLPASLERAGKYFDGWFPSAPPPDVFASGLKQVRDTARAAGRDPGAVEGAIYLTVALDEDAAKADARLNSFLERYYMQPAAVMRARQACYAGPVSGVAECLESYAKAGVDHFCVRFAGEHDSHMTALTKARVALGW
jgi:alkanesulfonate monooxygenase SsuD/methylene tetrahydromethanopterin reductase-like flavin-dependent oxidoreductase (luciferase family)